MLDTNEIAKALDLPSLSKFLSKVESGEIEEVQDEVYLKKLWEDAVVYTADTILEKAGLYLDKIYPSKTGRKYTGTSSKYKIEPMGGRSWQQAVSRIYHIMTGYGLVPDKLPKTESGAKKFVMKNWPLLALDHKVFGGKRPERIFWDYLR